MQHHNGPFTIPAINNFIPEKMKPWICILLVVVFQFSGGVYLAAASEMAGHSGLMQEDILMAGYASLAGMALTFAIMLRLKMRFSSRTSLITCTTALIVANAICLHTSNMVVLVSTCFFAGIFKMWATFECNSTIQLWLTPRRDLSKFFCYIYLLVHGSILLSGSATIWVTLFANWQHMHWFITGALLVVLLAVVLLFNNKRMGRPFPLYGIDWLGALLWGLSLLSLIFICVYGEHYDWWNAEEIRIATGFLLALTLLNILRASFIRHPFIALKTFRYKAVYMTFGLYILVDIFLAPAHFVEHIYFQNSLTYDGWHIISTNLISWMGVIAGAVFSYIYFASKKHSYKSTFLIGFSSVLLYLLLMYFLIDANTTKQQLVVPLFLRNFGYVVIAITLLTNLTKVPFSHFFQAVCVQGMVSAAFGGALGTAVLHHVFGLISGRNFQSLTAEIDRVNHQLPHIDPMQLSRLVESQVLLESFKELYGYLVIFGIGCFVLFCFYRYPYAPKGVLYPRMRAIRKMLKKEMA